jgi:Fic family protein
MPAGYSWHPIEDYEAEPKTLTDGEMVSLARIWARQKDELADVQTLDEFNKRLRREWSIETGIIEKAYTLDRGVTRTLIERGIDAALIPHGASDRDNVLVARLIQDHYDALEGMFDFVAGQRELSIGYVKELHAALMRNVETYTAVDQLGRVFDKELQKGAYKTAPNSPTRPDGAIHEYCPPEHVASEMDRLIGMYREHRERSIPVEVEAAWLHHRFTQIHPFQDGNGRVARALATLVLIKAGWFPLTIKRDDWTRYIDASEAADRRDLRPLVALFVEAQRNVLIQATEAIFEVHPPESTEEAIGAVRDRLLQRGKRLQIEWVRAKETAELVVEDTLRRLREIASELGKQIQRQGYSFSAAARQEEEATFVDLTLVTGDIDLFCIMFEPVGPRFHGMIAAVPYFGPDRRTAASLPTGAFVINYAEPASDVRQRFAAWLERAIVAGLTEWRRTL